MQEKNEALSTPIRYIKGVGPKKGEHLERAGIRTIEDIFYYLPARYEDRSNFTKIRDLKLNEYQTVTGEVLTAGLRRAKSGLPIFQASVTDGTGSIPVVWFNQPYLKDYIRSGMKVVLYGKVELHERPQITQPEYEVLKADGVYSVNMGRIVPVYHATAELTQKYLRSISYAAIEKYSKATPETLPTYIIARNRLVDARFAVYNIHFPASFENLEKAYRRIVFEEFFLLQLALAIRKRGVAVEKGLSHRTGGRLVADFIGSLPFELTDGQKRAIADIERDMSGAKPMNRLLEGDVGSGKTAVAASALVLTAANGHQGVVMAPTEVLARQHFVLLSEMLMPLGINVALLVGGMDPERRGEVVSGIRDGRIDIVVGTHAIIQQDVEFRSLGLAVVDEQHKFGVEQRAILKGKGTGSAPHALLMTATPIPRTLALTVYGDLDISIIRELPKGRKPIVTYLVEKTRRAEAYSFVREELARGRQAYVVCPLIDKSVHSPQSIVHGAIELYEKLKNGEFKDFEIGLLHGKMSSKEKDKVMKDFKKGRIQALVSTVVIEVGIDVPNAAVMLVEDADRFGLAQLHQLRGRVGRGKSESFCILLADPASEEAASRLKVLEETVDGFQIAEADLELRGPGEFFGTAQHGLPEIRFGNILKDMDIMELARKEAFALVARDPELGEDHHSRLKWALKSKFGGKFNLVNVG